jgi:alcohol dehydrogenase YqhD (iron-dependent ADH family)
MFFLDTDSMTGEEAVDAGISRFADWMKATNMYLTLSDVGIGAEKLEEMAETTIKLYGYGRDYIDNARELRKEDIIKVYEMAL